MVTEPTIRGLAVQQGALTVCCKLFSESSQSAQALLASHTVARTCITLNPNLVPPHIRLDTIRFILVQAFICLDYSSSSDPNNVNTMIYQLYKSTRPLLLLCISHEAEQLQQFEALLALTNILSVGQEEQDKFVSSKGIRAVFHLMFSENLMIRRAAVEALCNMSSHEVTYQLYFEIAIESIL